jgi:hypothetical protein
MKNRIFLLLPILSLASCSVISTKDVGALVYAKQSKEKADAISLASGLDKAKYKKGQQDVANWMDALGERVKRKGDQWLPISQVSVAANTIPADVKTSVEAALAGSGRAAPQAASPVIALQILEALRKWAQDGRKAEAIEVKKELDSYKWKSLP